MFLTSGRRREFESTEIRKNDQRLSLTSIRLAEAHSIMFNSNACPFRHTNVVYNPSRVLLFTRL